MPITRLVRQDGSGAYLDHTSAFLACGAGDSVETGDSGSYAEQVTIYALAGQSWIVSPGCTPEVTFGTGNTVTVNDGATGLTIRGLTLDNSGPHSCLHLLGESTGFVVDGCVFAGASATAISGATYVPGQDVTLVDSSITCAVGLYAATFAAVAVARCTIAVTVAALRSNAWQGTIDRCEIILSGLAYLSASIAATGTYSGAVAWTNCLVLDLTDASATTMLSVYDTSTPYSVLGCTFVGVGAYAAANIPCIWMDVGAGNLGQIAIQGNIITGFLSGLRGNAGTYTDAYNDLYGNGTNYAAGTAQGGTSISADPLFVGGGDYRIQLASPCLGTSADLGLTEDLDGDPRPAAGTARYDIGCYNGYTAVAIVPWLPPSVYVSLGGDPIDGSSIGLLPADGEPEGAKLVRAVWLSLLCHRLAEPDDALPDPYGDPPDRRGWWGDSDATVPGDRVGSRLWLLHRTRGADVAGRAEEYVREALQWLLEDGLASAVTCSATPAGNRLDMDVRIYRPVKGQGAPVRLSWDLWGGL